MNYEYFDLGLIVVNLLFCGFLLHRQNNIVKKNKKLQKLVVTSISNPKQARKLLNKFGE
tara:strand:- start:619 stop:795 length:177 start_codon:yes stop_codon:yes gene_type:complete